MPTRRMLLFSGACLALTAVLSGCGAQVPTEPAKPIPVYNPNPNDPNKDITLENEAANMDRLQGKKTKAPRK